MTQFSGFAAAGVKYADTVPAVFDQALEEAVKIDSLVLLESRATLGQQERIEAINESNANLRKRLEIFNALKEHANNLRAYFLAIKALSASDAKSGITQAARDAANSLAKVSGRIENLAMGKLPLKDFLGQAVPLAVTSFQSSALNAELKARANFIERELDLQQAALSAISASMRSDVETQMAGQDRDKIVLPYVRDEQIPDDWQETRLNFFKRRIELSAVDAAAKAARNVRLSFLALVENRLDEHKPSVCSSLT